MADRSQERQARAKDPDPGKRPRAGLGPGPSREKLHEERLRRRAERRLRATLRYLRLVATKFWLTFLAILFLLALGAVLFHSSRFDEIDNRSPDWSESLFATYSLFALQPPYKLPHSWPLRVLYFTYPLFGLVVVADALVRVTLLLFSRQENQKEWTKVLASTYRDHIILCGLGRVGYRILERLLQWNLDVVVIEKDDHSSFLQRVQQLKVPVLLLDARQEESLAAAGIAHARTLVICTNDDLANVEIALDARRLNPQVRVVLRMFDEDIANKLRDAFNLDIAFSSAAAAAPIVAASVLDLDILGSFNLDGRELFTARVTIAPGSSLVGHTIAEIGSERRVMVLSRKQGSEPQRFSPEGSEILAASDQLVVHGELDTLRVFGRLAGRR